MNTANDMEASNTTAPVAVDLDPVGEHGHDLVFPDILDEQNYQAFTARAEAQEPNRHEEYQMDEATPVRNNNNRGADGDNATEDEAEEEVKHQRAMVELAEKLHVSDASMEMFSLVSPLRLAHTKQMNSSHEEEPLVRKRLSFVDDWGVQPLLVTTPPNTRVPSSSECMAPKVPKGNKASGKSTRKYYTFSRFVKDHLDQIRALYTEQNSNRISGENVMECKKNSMKKCLISRDQRIAHHIPRHVTGSLDLNGKQAFYVKIGTFTLSGKLLKLPPGQVRFEDPRDCRDLFVKIHKLYCDVSGAKKLKF